MDILTDKNFMHELVRSYFLDHHLSFEQGLLKALDYMQDYEYEEFLNSLYLETRERNGDV